MTQFCGSKPISVGYVDGFGGNDWRKTVHYLFELDAKQCPNITKTYYENANDDLQQYSSDMSSLVTQGVNVIVTFDDFGPAALPAIRAAHKAGVAVVPFIANPSGAPGTDYTTFVSLNNAAVGAAWAKWLNQALGGKGTVVMLGGTPGNPTSPEYLAGFVSAAKAYPGLKVVSNAPVTTNWTAAGEQKAMSGILSRYPNISAIMTDDVGAYPAVLAAYQQAGVQPGPVAGFSSLNADGCLWAQNHSKYPHLQMFSKDGEMNAVSIALRKGIAQAEGKADPEADKLTLSDTFNTLAGVEPKCVPSLPADADFAANAPDGNPLTTAELKQALGAS
jgi:ribose transport system substrate-binding protein